MYGSSLFWRETHRQPRFLIFDGRLVILLLLMVMHIRIWTVLIAVTAGLVVWYFERKGVSVESIVRYIRAAVIGRHRSARGRGAERYAVDFGFETHRHIRQMDEFVMSREKSEAALKAKNAKKSKHK